jgi:hypothetical protein
MHPICWILSPRTWPNKSSGNEKEHLQKIQATLLALKAKNYISAAEPANTSGGYCPLPEDLLTMFLGSKSSILDA